MEFLVLLCHKVDLAIVFGDFSGDIAHLLQSSLEEIVLLSEYRYLSSVLVCLS